MTIHCAIPPDFVHKYVKIPHSSYAQLFDKTRFAEVKCDGSTLYWEDGLDFEDTDGQIKKGLLDIAPEVLFELTKEEIVFAKMKNEEP